MGGRPQEEDGIVFISVAASPERADPPRELVVLVVPTALRVAASGRDGRRYGLKQLPKVLPAVNVDARTGPPLRSAPTGYSRIFWI